VANGNDQRNDQRPVRIVLADDHAILRDGLRRLLESKKGFEVVGEAADGREAIQQVSRLEPDILLLDMAMPNVTGLAALEELAKSNSSTKVILLTALIDKKDTVAALQLGARGVVLKESATELLLKCIETVLAGHHWVGRGAVADLIEALRDMSSGTGGNKQQSYGFTKRELEIIGAIVAGDTNKHIAKRFSISEDTVKHHLTSIFDKAGVSTRLELALFAVHHKVVSTD
jgi:two-component system, NarL family, nitrate/nitrite response regulator NarL